MSIEKLREDMRESTSQLAALAAPGLAPSVESVVSFLRLTLWPTIEAVVDELSDVDGCVEDLLNDSEDILQPKTAELFAALVVAGREIAAELGKRLTSSASDADAKKLVAGFADLSNAAEAAIQEITIPDDDEDGEDEDEVTT
jgi:hypothetical protein